MVIKVNQGQTLAVIKQAMWLAWQACGGPLGMGFLQDNPTATKEDVWQNVQHSGDYVVEPQNSKNSVYADYVFGRMMKLNIQFDLEKDEITVSDYQPRPDYQGWCRKYITYGQLIQAAKNSL